jgi:hypothetical protein
MDRTLFCPSSTGVRQGCVLSPLFFAIGLQPIFLEIRERFPDIHIFGFLDDISLTGPRESLVAAYADIKRLGADIGLVVNPTKSYLYSKTPPAELERTFNTLLMVSLF